MSNGIGLANVATKHQLLGPSAVWAEERTNQLLVTLPLLGQTAPLGEA